MKIRPLADRVVIKKFEAEEKTASGIVLPTAAKEQPQMAEVIEVGPGGMVDGNEVKMEVKVGDKVIFSKYAGNESFTTDSVPSVPTAPPTSSFPLAFSGSSTTG